MADWSRFNQKYKDAIFSEHFKKLRADLLRDVGKCEVCGHQYIFRKFGLTLHHKHYRTLGKETREDVVLICRWCHGKIHGKKQRSPHPYERK